MAEDIKAGKVVSWKDEGYGFIRPDGHNGRELYFHAKNVHSDGVKRIGARVAFAVAEGDRGLQAVQVRAEQNSLPDGECDVLTEEEFRHELAAVSQQMVAVEAVLAAARRHGWIDG